MTLSDLHDAAQNALQAHLFRIRLNLLVGAGAVVSLAEMRPDARLERGAPLELCPVAHRV